MAYRILIADDEEKIIKLILKIGAWQALNIEVVATCSDGAETIRCIRELKPDIVLTDIKMPIYDGIQLIEMAKEAGLETHFIVLSGYKHFEYAHSAIRLGVVDYLLKPLDEEQLNRALEKACQMIDVRSYNVQVGRELEDYQKQEDHQKKQQLLDLLVSGKDEADFPANNLECNQIYKTDFVYDRYRCLLLTTNLGVLMDASQSLFPEKIQEIIPTVFGDGYRCATRVSKTCVLVVLNYSGDQKQTLRQTITALYYRLKNQVEIYGDFTLNIGVSSEKTDIRQLGVACQEAYTAEWGRLVLMSDKVLEYELLKNLPRFAIRDLLSEADEEKLVNDIRFFQREAVADFFAELAKTAGGYCSHYPGDMAAFLLHLAKTVFPVHLGSNNGESLTAIRDELYILNKTSRNFQDEIKKFYIYLDKWLGVKLREIREQRNKPIDEARKYIEANYAQQLNLAVVADMVHVSPNYFSKLFKIELGIGFSEYLVDVRIKKSQEMLLRSNLSIKTIAERVGYPDEKYFCRLFKKQVGIKPSEYRKLYTGNKV